MSDVVALGYHAVSPSWPAVLASTPGQLDRQVRLLLGRGYTPTSFHRAVTDPPAARTLSVTFDDAYGSVIERAFPILEAHGVPGTVFVPTSFVGDERPMSWPGIEQWLGGRHEDELRCMSWEDLRHLTDAGWEIGTHAHSHPVLPNLPDYKLADELGRSRELCRERLGIPCRSVSYPYGEYDERVVAAARAAGYEAGATLALPLSETDPLRFPRVGVYRADDLWRFRAKVSLTVRRLRAARARRPAARSRAGGR